MDTIPFGEAPLPTTAHYNDLIQYLWGTTAREPVLCEAYCRLAARWLELLLQSHTDLSREIEAMEESFVALEGSSERLHDENADLINQVDDLKNEKSKLSTDLMLAESKLKAANDLLEYQARIIMENETATTKLVEEMTRLRNERDRLYGDLDRAGIKEWNSAA